MTKPKSKSRAGCLGSHGAYAWKGSTALSPERAAALRAEAGEMLAEMRQSKMAAGSVSAGSSMTADMASIEAALTGLIDVETMDKISDLIVRAPAVQVAGMLALTKLIKEGRS